MILNLSSSAVRIMKTFAIKGRQCFESISGMSACKGRNFEAWYPRTIYLWVCWFFGFFLNWKLQHWFATSWLWYFSVQTVSADKAWFRTNILLHLSAATPTLLCTPYVGHYVVSVTLMTTERDKQTYQGCIIGQKSRVSAPSRIKVLPVK